MTYRDAGVDIDAGAALVEAIKPLARATMRPGSTPDLGGFGAMFDLKEAGYLDPILVAGSDGVGTKLKVAIEADSHATVGIDLVAMCVNDLLVQGAEPLFFLDYFACSKLDPKLGESIVKGIAEGCKAAGCALIGGETAEMPGMYRAGDYDLAGFAVGAVERDKVLSGKTVSDGDVILGLASSGLHSNGFSLVRRVVSDLGLDYCRPAPFDATRTLADALLEPTRIYVNSCLKAFPGGHIKALAHITGGGLPENIPRVLPDGLRAEIDAASWQPPAVFKWLAKDGHVDWPEMARTFNLGIGMAVVTSAEGAPELSDIFTRSGEKVVTLGRIAGAAADKPTVCIEGMETAWRN